MNDQCFKCGKIHLTESAYYKCMSKDLDKWDKYSNMEDQDENFSLEEYEMELDR